MNNYNIIFIFFLLVSTLNAQTEHFSEEIESTFFKEQNEISSSLNTYMNNNFYKLHIMDEEAFIHKIDSLRGIYSAHLSSYKTKIRPSVYKDEILGIKLSFDRFILRYPLLHKNFTGNDIELSQEVKGRLEKNKELYNNSDALKNSSFKNYLRTYIDLKTQKLDLSDSQIYDNQKIAANWMIIESTFTNPEATYFFKYELLKDYINNYGIKNINDFYNDFVKNALDQDHISDIQNLYKTHQNSRSQHKIEIYKKVAGVELEIHLFLPDSDNAKKHPTMIQFHGGSWSEGKPDWFFDTAKAYADEGWVVAVAEYRIKGRHGNYPFSSVKDAKSAIRWIKANAGRLGVDKDKILVTGNSAGGHLALATAIVDGWDEDTDDLSLSSVPNVVIVNSAVYDLTTNNSQWITEKEKDKDIVKEISPNHLVKKSPVKFFLIHGKQDRNCEYETAEYFYNSMKAIDNNVQLYSLENASHMIWYGKHSEEVSKATAEYIKTLNWL